MYSYFITDESSSDNKNFKWKIKLKYLTIDYLLIGLFGLTLIP